MHIYILVNYLHMNKYFIYLEENFFKIFWVWM